MNIERKLEQTITVEELIEALQEMDPKDRVVFASDYGDHMHTQQVHLIRGNIVDYPVRESAYSSSGLALYTGDPEDQDDEQDPLPVVLVIE